MSIMLEAGRGRSRPLIFSAISMDPVQQSGRSHSVRTPQCVRQPAAAEAEEEKVPGPRWPEESPGGSPPLPSGVAAPRQQRR